MQPCADAPVPRAIETERPGIGVLPSSVSAAELSTSVADAVTGSLKSPADAPVYVRVVDAVTAGGAMRPIWLVSRSVNHNAWSGPAVMAPAPAPGVGISNSSSTAPAGLM